MRRWKVYVRRVGNQHWFEAHRSWTKAGAERWAVANRVDVLDRWDYWKVTVKP